MTELTPPRDTTDTEALAELIWGEAPATSSISTDGALVHARRILASDWLRDRDAALRAEALREAADDFATDFGQELGRDDLLNIANWFDALIAGGAL